MHGSLTNSMKCLKDLPVFSLVLFSQGNKLIEPQLVGVDNSTDISPNEFFFRLEVVSIKGYDSFRQLLIPQMIPFSTKESSQQ